MFKYFAKLQKLPTIIGARSKVKAYEWLSKYSTKIEPLGLVDRKKQNLYGVDFIINTRNPLHCKAIGIRKSRSIKFNRHLLTNNSFYLIDDSANNQTLFLTKENVASALGQYHHQLMYIDPEYKFSLSLNKLDYTIVKDQKHLNKLIKDNFNIELKPKLKNHQSTFFPVAAKDKNEY